MKWTELTKLFEEGSDKISIYVAYSNAPQNIGLEEDNYDLKYKNMFMIFNDSPKDIDLDNLKKFLTEIRKAEPKHVFWKIAKYDIDKKFMPAINLKNLSVLSHDKYLDPHLKFPEKFPRDRFEFKGIVEKF